VWVLGQRVFGVLWVSGLSACRGLFVVLLGLLLCSF
jgi:hypothetical protein